MACSYQYEGHTFTSASELNEFLLKNMHKIGSGVIPARFSIGDSVNERAEEFRNYKGKIMQDFQKLGINEDGKDYKYKPGYSSVTSVIRNAKQPNGRPYVTPFSEQDYINEEVAKGVKEGKSEGEVLAEVTQKLENWKKLAAYGSDIHKVAELYFSDTPIRDKLEIMKATALNATAVSDMLDIMQSFDTYLTKSFGPGYVVIPEFYVKNDDAKIHGVIDLVVIDSKGDVHIFDYKASYKGVLDWHSTKIQSIKYQMGFYRELLASEGLLLDPTKTTLNILPLELKNINYDTNQIEGVNVGTPFNLLSMDRHLDYRSGAYITSNIQELIPASIQSLKVDINLPSKVNVQCKEAFSYDLALKRNYTDIEGFKRSSFLQKTNDGFKFKNLVTNKWISTTKENLDAEIEKYLRELATSNSNLATETISIINPVITTAADWNSISPRKDQRKLFYQNQFNKYTTGEWQMLDTFAHLGIITFYNKNTRIMDFVSVTANNISEKVKLKFHDRSSGGTILGNFVRDRHVSNPYIMDSSNGSMEIIKTMLVLNDSADILPRGMKIGEISVINPLELKGVNYDIKRTKETFKNIVERLKSPEAKTENNFENGTLEMAEPLEIMRSRFNALSETDMNAKIIGPLFSKFEEVVDAKGAVTALKELEESMRVNFAHLGNSVTSLDTPEKRLYVEVQKAKLYYSNLITDYSEGLTNYGAVKGEMLNGLMINNPDSQISVMLLSMKKLQDTATIKIRSRQMDEGNMQRKKTQDFINNSGYSRIQSEFVGDMVSAYRNLFVNDPNDSKKLHPSLMFKNPYIPDKSLSEPEIEYLKFVLETINRNRYGCEYGTETAENYIEEGSWFEAPLMRGGMYNKIRNSGVKKGITASLREWWDENLNFNKLLDKKQSKELKDKANDMLEMVDTIQMSNVRRTDLLEEKGVDNFSTDVEMMMLATTYSKIRKEEYDKILPDLHALSVVLQASSITNNLDLNKVVSYIKDQIKSTVYNVLPIEEESEGLYKVTGAVRKITSGWLLGFNVNSMTKELVQGFYNNFARSFIGTGDIMDEKSYIKAMFMVCKESKNNEHMISKLKNLNLLYAMGGIDTNSVVDEQSSNRSGIFGFLCKSEALHWVNHMPDYYNRMSVLVAKMLKDGTYDAHYNDENGILQYDWRKDLRFDKFANGDKSNMVVYNKQRSLYLAMMNDFNNNEGYELTEGDALPRAYTSNEASSIKSFANSIHGYMDSESTFLWKKTLLGAAVMQFRTFLSGKKTLYTLKPGHFIRGNFKQQYDANGMPLFLKEVKDDETGLIKTIITTENTGVEYQIYEGDPQEGILYSIWDTYKLIKDGKYKDVLADDVRAHNIKLFSYDLGLVALLLAFSALFDLDDLAKDSPAAAQVGKTFIKAGNDNFMLSVVTGFVFNTEPPSLRVLSSMYTNFSQMVTAENPDAMSFLTKSFGAFKSLQYIATPDK